MQDEPKTPATGKEETAAAPATWSPFETLHREIDHLFENFRHGYLRNPFTDRPFEADLPEFMRAGLGRTPATDFVEKDDCYEISVEVPGVDMKDVKVQIAKDRLTIRGEKREEKEEHESGRYVSERRYGSFSRSFRLPEDVDADAIQAVQDKGVLKLSLPKRPEAKAEVKEIEVKAS